MKKEIGKWFMDIAKYVATAILISSFLGSFEQKWAIYVVGTVIVIVGFFGWLIFYSRKKNRYLWKQLSQVWYFVCLPWASFCLLRQKQAKEF
ncbi:MAG: hypothetical protein LBT04_08245 [Prevotellaceae bacterium]|jgi:hypothetical protein|nr:hypothetical protein [Prevotellaceae bacterium]